MHPTGGYGHPGTSGDRGLALLAARQHRVVSTAQLMGLGYSMRAIQRRVEAKRLHRLQRGVYAVGHTKLSRHGRWMAAALACGPDAVLSHGTAAAVWEIWSTSGQIHVTTLVRRRVAGVHCHVSRTALRADDRTTIDALPVISLDRTLLDLAELVSLQRLRSALENLQRRDLLNAERLEALIARSHGRRGIKPLKAVLATLHDEAPWTQSERERRFLELIRGAGLPEPQCNVVVAGRVVDAFWPQQRLVVEIDSYWFHKTHRAFEADRRRDAELQIAGYRVVRITDQRIAREPDALVGDLQRLLACGV